ncbi:HK97 gp10 family phage protein [Bacillus mesophilum]|uniref:HK97 gp10 family phage protein n=1 Tax=Bacillus mesophilum TaxID=1071718 RepID=A0A7V7RPB2_9BACI|nr:HK97 gp10 family phage protein [Bacillus mesophilum]KAB2335084.1 HK97 gp10 family phage protein [Bacillus mesophilum]
MANQSNFSLQGIQLMINQLDQIEREMEQRIDQVLTRLAEKIILDAKKLAPIDSGDLEAALVVGEVKNLLRTKYIEFGTSPEVNDYAVVQHEGFRRTSSGEVVQLTPGPKTQSKAPHKGYMPGRKYLENAIAINEQLIITELRNALSF